MDLRGLQIVSKQTTYATPQGDSAERQTVLVAVSHLFVSEIVVSILALHALRHRPLTTSVRRPLACCSATLGSAPSPRRCTSSMMRSRRPVHRRSTRTQCLALGTTALVWWPFDTQLTAGAVVNRAAGSTGSHGPTGLSRFVG